MSEVKITKTEVYRSTDGWRWRARGGNGEPIAVGEGYKDKRDAIAAAKAVAPQIEPEVREA